jgi:hypothetical protein
MGRGGSPQPQKRKPVMGKKKGRGNRKGMCLEDRPLLEPHTPQPSILAPERSSWRCNRVETRIR